MNHPTLAHIYRVATMKGTCALLILREQVPASELDKCKCKTAGKKTASLFSKQGKIKKKTNKIFSILFSYTIIFITMIPISRKSTLKYRYNYRCMHKFV